MLAGEGFAVLLAATRGRAEPGVLVVLVIELVIPDHEPMTCEAQPAPTLDAGPGLSLKLCEGVENKIKGGSRARIRN